MAYATSRSPAFALASAPLHAACITMLWMRSTSCDGRRWMGVAGGVLWYLQPSQKLPPSASLGASAPLMPHTSRYCAPMLRVWPHLVGAIAPMVVGAAVAFVPKLRLTVFLAHPSATLSVVC